MSVTQAEKGARLRVVLDAAQATRTRSNAAASGSAIKLGRAAVLIVDDERSVSAILGRALANHEVTAVDSAKEALEQIEAGTNFDLILSDLMMPGMSGMEFYDTVARERPRLAERMVFMSGGAFTPTARAFLDRVPNERIEKPFNLKAVRELVQKFAK